MPILPNTMSCKPASGSKAVERLLTSTGRRKQPSHVFSALFYATHVEPFIDYDAYTSSLAPEEKPMTLFAYRNFCTREAWKKAPLDVQQQVSNHKKLLDMSVEELEDLLVDIGSQGSTSSADAPNMDNTPQVDGSEAGEPVSGTVLEGKKSSESPTTLGSNNLSADTADSGKTSKAKPGNNPESSEETLTDQAVSKFKLAITETLQMKKMDDREKYVFIP